MTYVSLSSKSPSSKTANINFAPKFQADKAGFYIHVHDVGADIMQIYTVSQNVSVLAR